MLIAQIFVLLAFSTTIENATQMEKERVNLGHTRFRFKPIIVKGEPASQSEIPYMVSIKTRAAGTNDSDIFVWKSFCGGSLLGPRRALTVANCFDGRHFNRVRFEHKFMVVAGELQSLSEHSVYPSTEGTSQWRKIENVKVHKNYSFPNSDIALVTVVLPFSFDSNVGPVRIARRTMDYPTTCRTAGFRQQEGPRPPMLIVAEIAPISRDECKRLWGRDMGTFICTFSVVPDSTFGDPGGPLGCRGTMDPTEQPGSDLLVGIISTKNSDRTALFTRVSTYANWIEGNLASKLRSCVFIVIMPFYLLFL